MDAQERLIAALEQEQAKRKETDGPFAKRIGMSRQMWRLLKAREANLSLPIIQGILSVYPDLGPLATALLFLPSDAKKPSLMDTTLTKVPA